MANETKTGIAPMELANSIDLRYERQLDYEVRKLALDQAVKVSYGIGEPKHILASARAFYDFLKGE